MYVPVAHERAGNLLDIRVHTAQKCYKCVFYKAPFCHIRERFGLPEVTSRAAVLVCWSLLTQWGIPEDQLSDYHWQKASDHTILED